MQFVRNEQKNDHAAQDKLSFERKLVYKSHRARDCQTDNQVCCNCIERQDIARIIRRHGLILLDLGYILFCDDAFEREINVFLADKSLNTSLNIGQVPSCLF